jgi:hypothetical protein
MDYSLVVFSNAFGYGSIGLRNRPSLWLLSSDYRSKFYQRNWFDITALVPMSAFRRGKEMTDLLYARHRTIDC